MHSIMKLSNHSDGAEGSYAFVSQLFHTRPTPWQRNVCFDRYCLMYYNILTAKGVPPPWYIFQVCCQICLIITKTAETCSRWQTIRIVLRVVFVPKINAGTTGWRYQKKYSSLPTTCPGVFFFLPFSLSLHYEPRQFCGHVYSNVNFTESRNYIMYSHFNQFFYL